MFLSFYTFIILIVHITNSEDVNHQFLEPLKIKKTLLRIRRNVMQTESENKRNDEINNEAKLFDYIQEDYENTSPRKIANREENTLKELKVTLENLLKKINDMNTCCSRRNAEKLLSSTTEGQYLVDVDYAQRKKYQSDSKSNHPSRRSRWGQWTPWSSCSVSCGKGRVIRWRHCREQCESAETEMEEKTCQLPACGPGNLFGIKL